MAIVSIELGNAPNDNNGDALRVGGQKINANFQDLQSQINNLKFAPIINGWLTLKLNANYAIHEEGDIIAGLLEADRFVIAEILTLPANLEDPFTEGDLYIYVDRQKVS